jgi:hypothetical protein
MDDSLPMSVVERLSDVRGDPHRIVHGKLMLTVDAVAEGLALDVRHDVEQEAVGLAGIEQRQDVWMLEVGCDLDLGQKAFSPDNRSQFRLQDLEGHFAVVLEVVGQVDRGHAALAQFTLDGIAAF